LLQARLGEGAQNLSSGKERKLKDEMLFDGWKKNLVSPLRCLSGGKEKRSEEHYFNVSCGGKLEERGRICKEGGI